ncbi:UvrD-helicase domain-containing protein [Mycobacteroides abscessus]|uniref:UvrD-helicase domain-containing protein n=1 Tax=Mycobacteroides abscessus TaxID=36809 RepID=UPI00232C7BBC|nr:UvrD-helicase domain-containing protein [Mycobacteroides abscessus]MDB2197155.1 UvrD-helicase domain-containing protein [Mycobacteroides abscessus subsp. abscessus]MDB2201985.1 UvrD-helicase domain-containing protein [Mycobacteroides abscessus subsp. abscessus]
MTEPFVPNGKAQRQVVETRADLTVVLGGAGTGKTVCALAAARNHLENPGTSPHDRVLFLSFSRAAVGRLLDRCAGILGAYTDRVDFMTFHALSYSVVHRFSSLLDRPHVQLVNKHCREIRPLEAYEIEYDDLHPLACRILDSCPAAADLIQKRWGLVIVDEFQDTDNEEEALLDIVTRSARRILLGDQQQCIYADFRGADGVRLDRITDACKLAGPDNVVTLPNLSHRDPTGVIPAVARAVMERRFTCPALLDAINDERLQIWRGIDYADEVATIEESIRRLRADDLEVAVFTHHVDVLAKLADGLEDVGVQLEIAGLGDALACAIDSQVAMLKYAVADTDWAEITDTLAIFVISAQRGKKVPQLAWDIVHRTGSSKLQSSLDELRAQLTDSASATQLLAVAAQAHQFLGLPGKLSAWERAGSLLKPLRARAVRQLGSGASTRLVVRNITAAAREASTIELTNSRADHEPHVVQLMNLYQTKGREADATIIVLRGNDFMGKESSPFPHTSRLLYVVFSRARKRIVVLLVGDTFPDPVAPLQRLAHPIPRGFLP